MTTEIFASNEVYVGRDFGGIECVVDGAVIENYIAATGDDYPWYRGASPLGGAVAPALTVHSAVFRNRDWYLPNLFGNLHARQEWQGFAPIRPGDRLHTRSVVVERYLKRDREYVVNECLVLDAPGRVIQRSRTHQSFLMNQGGGFAVDREREKSAARSFKVGERGGELIETPMRTIT
ncbi:MAG: hypothetical protein ACREQD_04000, partial [Candidatus Binataceae bacterium]